MEDGDDRTEDRRRKENGQSTLKAKSGFFVSGLFSGCPWACAGPGKMKIGLEKRRSDPEMTPKTAPRDYKLSGS
jgi:hypothetical protein